MAAVIAEPAAAGSPPVARKGKKKLIVILAVALLVLAALGGGAVYYLKKKAAQAAAEAAEGDGPVAEAVAEKHGPVTPHTYLPLDPFVVNLADRDSDRYAQIGITLELQNLAAAEQFKLYMPSVRNAILMVITRKSSRDLLDPMGKEALAEEIKREAVRPMGIEIAAPEPVTVAVDAASGPARAASATEDVAPAKKAKRKADAAKNPIQAVNFSSFIIQ